MPPKSGLQSLKKCKEAFLGVNFLKAIHGTIIFTSLLVVGPERLKLEMGVSLKKKEEERKKKTFYIVLVLKTDFDQFKTDNDKSFRHPCRDTRQNGHGLSDLVRFE